MAEITIPRAEIPENKKTPEFMPYMVITKWPSDRWSVRKTHSSHEIAMAHARYLKKNGKDKIEVAVYGNRVLWRKKAKTKTKRKRK